MDMLADPAARRPAFGDDLPLDLPFRAAAKTGTSGGFADNWTVIATREYVVAAWAGNFDGRPMHQMLAMWGAAPLARAALLAAADGRALTLPDAPPNIVTREVCRLSGRAPGAHCPIAREHFIAGTEPHDRCDWHRVVDGEVRVAWPAEVAAWAATHARE
jgi:penicillin-binding protein 1C